MESRETATEELRRMLDERGVEWRVGGETRHNKNTIWECEAGTAEFYEDLSNGSTSLVLQHRDGMTRLTITSDMTPAERFVTPEQAIAATMERGTCHITDSGPWGYPYVCSACGASFGPDVNNGEVNFCPNCGRKVVDA